MDRVLCDGTRPGKLLYLFLRFVRACNDNHVSKAKTLYLVSCFLIGTAATWLNDILPDAAGNSAGRSVASFLRRCTGSW